MTEGVESAVSQAKAAAAGKSVGVHGADSIQQLVVAGVGVTHLRYPVRKA